MNMMRPKYVFLVLLLIPFHLLARDNLRLPDIRSIAIGNNGVTQSTLYNPSLIALVESRVIHLNYFNRYGLKELGSVNGSFLYPNSVLPASLNVYSFGYDEYRETMLRASVGKRLNEYWSIGIAVHYSMLETELYDEHKGRVSTDIGATYSPFDNLLIGLLIMNMPSVHIGDQATKDKDFKGYIIQLGLEWEIVNNLLIIGNMGTDKDNTVIGALGVEYQAFRSFYIRGGMEMRPLLPTFGVGYDFPRFSMDVAAIYHPVLGVSTGLGLSFSF